MVAVVFIVSVCVFLGWGFVHQNKKASTVSRTKPLASAASSDGRRSTDEKDGDLPLPVCSNFRTFVDMLLYFCSPLAIL